MQHPATAADEMLKSLTRLLDMAPKDDVEPALRLGVGLRPPRAASLAQVSRLGDREGRGAHAGDAVRSLAAPRPAGG